MKKILKYWKPILLVLIVMALLVIAFGGNVYYAFILPETDLFYRISMDLQNCMECLLFNPTLTVYDMAEDAEFIAFINSDGMLLQLLLTKAYAVAMVLVPFIDVLIVFSILDTFLHFFGNITLERKRVLIIGYNDKTKRLLNTGITKGKLYLWTDEVLSSDEERNLIFHRVSVKQSDFSLGDDPKSYGAQKKAFNSFLKKKKITHVVLMDEMDSKNIQYYMALSDCEVCKTRTIHFFSMIDDFENRDILKNFFDRKLIERYGVTTKDSNGNVKCDEYGEPVVKIKGETHMDLNIFNYPEVQAQILFENLPLFRVGTTKGKDRIHMLVVGGGEEGENILLAAMNLSVFSNDNEVEIDVIDRDPDALFGRLCERFSGSYIKADADTKTFSLDGEACDGKLTISIHYADATDSSFQDKVIKLQEGDNRYTYVVVCLPNEDINLHCALEIDKALYEKAMEVPIALRMSHSEELIKYISKLKSFSDVYFMGANEEYITLDNIINSELEEKVREYKYAYDLVSNAEIWGGTSKLKGKELLSVIDEKWNQCFYYQRRSNRALYLHKATKDALFGDCKKEFALLKACIEPKKEEIKAKALEGKSEEDIAKYKSPGEDVIMSEILIEKDAEGNLKYPTLYACAQAEHRRFDYFYASEGWGFSNWKDGNDHKVGAHDKNSFARLHDCLTNWDNLVANETKRYTLIYDLLSLLIEDNKKDERK